MNTFAIALAIQFSKKKNFLTTEQYISLVDNRWLTLELNSILLRKEVIQPHVPVRLPCYDLVPVTDPTLDSFFP